METGRLGWGRRCRHGRVRNTNQQQVPPKGRAAQTPNDEDGSAIPGLRLGTTRQAPNSKCLQNYKCQVVFCSEFLTLEGFTFALFS